MTPRKKKKLKSNEIGLPPTVPLDLATVDLGKSPDRKKSEAVPNTAYLDEGEELDPETPRVNTHIDCPVCGHSIGKHIFIPMEIIIDEEAIQGHAIFCTDNNCKFAADKGEACFTQNFLELLEYPDEE